MAEEFSCGLAKIRTGDKRFPTAFIDQTGKVIFKSKYWSVDAFRHGRALVRMKNRIGFFNKQGKIVIKTTYPYGSGFSDGIALVWSANSAEYIDTLGKRVAKFNEMGHSHFSEGWASVLGNVRGHYIDKAGNKVTIVSRSFYIDKKGRPVLTNTIDSLVYHSFVNGMAEVTVPGTGHKSGFIDKTGKIVVPIIYDFVMDFYGEYTIVFASGKDYIINKKGEIIADGSERHKYLPKAQCSESN
jgi:hypothetical protein